jgi:hypothetical protein
MPPRAPPFGSTYFNGLFRAYVYLFHDCGFASTVLNMDGSTLVNLPCAPEKYRAPK